MPPPPDPVEMAIEEWKLLNGIIGRLEEVEYKIRSWLFPLLTALAVALYFKQDEIPKIVFPLIATFLIFVFMAIELIHRPPKHKAIIRAGKIEEFLRDPTKKVYDGPKITESLSKDRWPGVKKECRRMISHGPYIPLFCFVLFLIILVAIL